jgi:glucosamine-phosphate N-acetyltransferase
MTDLFSKTLISQTVQSQLSSDFIVRPLSSSDYEKGFLSTLGMLTQVGAMSKTDFQSRFDYFKRHNHEYFTIVIEDVAKKVIVAAGTILVERKFVHNNGMALIAIILGWSYRRYCHSYFISRS